MEHDDAKFLLNFTPTGLVPSKEQTAWVPVSPDEIIREVREVARLGANMVHLHARDPQTGEPTCRPEVFREILCGIRAEHRDLVLVVSTSGRNFPDFAQRSACLELTGDARPDMGSLTLSSLNFNTEASLNAPEMIQRLAAKMLDNGIRPELEVFDLGMINYATYLARKGLIKPPHYFNLILGNIAGAQAGLLSLGLLVNELPHGSHWSAGGIGGSQLRANTMALVAGGGVRVGLEDNIYFDRRRTRLASNRELVERVLVIAEALGRQPYSHRETRTVLGLS